MSHKSATIDYTDRDKVIIRNATGYFAKWALRNHPQGRIELQGGNLGDHMQLIEANSHQIRKSAMVYAQSPEGGALCATYDPFKSKWKFVDCIKK